MASLPLQSLDVLPAAAKAISVFVLDNSRVFSSALQKFLDDEPNIHVVGVAVPTALAVAAAARPQVVVIDAGPNDCMIDPSVRQLRLDLPEAGIIVLSLHETEAEVAAECQAAMQAGANAFLDKWLVADDLVSAIYNVVAAAARAGG